MTGQEAIELIGLDRAKSISSRSEYLLESEAIVLNELKGNNFEIDSVYFDQDEKEKSFPAIFLKKVEYFDKETFGDIAEIHRKAWNYKKVLFLYVYSDTEIRIYNCAERPIITTKKDINFDKELRRIEIEAFNTSDEKQLEKLNKLFSRIAIDSGIVWTLEEAKFIRDQINLQRRVDKYLVSSLVKTANKLEIQGVKKGIIHKIILRSLFLLYLEDRGATDEKFYSNIKEGAKSYFDILDDVKSTYKLFTRLEEDFNGNVFTVDEYENISDEHLQIIKQCFITGYEDSSQTNLFEDWRLFNFSIIQIELLSEIYENFLAETDDTLKEDSGAYYTPPALVEFILNEKIPTKTTNTKYNIKVLDPSCGSGIFLIESFKRLVKRYENKHNKKLKDYNQLKKILIENIFGIELHSQAIKIAAFSLYLALVDNLDPKTLWQKKRLPYLINDPDEKDPDKQGYNLFCRDTIERNKEIEDIDFDLVVGNPPFGNRKLLPSIQKYCNNEDFAKEKVLPFLHKATKFSPRGEIALIFNTKVLTNTGGTYQSFRKWLFNNCYVEKVFNFSILRKAPKNHGGQLFSDATGPISIVFYQKEQPSNPSAKIAYYAPKTYIKSHMIDGLVINFTDLKYLPRKECQKPDTNIWKIAMWGGLKDWELIQKLNYNYFPISEFLKRNNLDYGVGFELSTPANKANTEIEKLPIHTPKNILKYYTPKPKHKIKAKKFRRLGKLEAYLTTHVLINEGIKVYDNQLSLIASYVDYPSAFSKGLIGVYSKNNDINLLKLLTIFLNSEFVKYYSFLMTSSWGIERDVVKYKELFRAPFLPGKLSESQKMHLIQLFNGLLFESNFYEINKEIENEINEIILGRLIEQDKFIIQHLRYNIDLFHKHEKSIALNPVPQIQINDYGEVISEEINSFLDGQNLFANSTIFKVGPFTPLMMIKLSLNYELKEITISSKSVDEQLKHIDKQLWQKKSTNIYFRKKLNYKSGNDIFIIRPNQRRFWSKSMALEDASELILEILNEN
ncbi:MAG: SAM-dependent methyltransferase [Bacteroidales bacterium]|nr:SAM-dependent methyltransferase [Bacteroidales bacterium]